MSEYKRLTRYSGKVMQEDCRNCNYAYNNVCNYKDKENKIIYDIDEDCKKVMLNRLAELEDKIMDGTLIELPYKLGTKLYFIVLHTFGGYFEIFETELWVYVSRYKDEFGGVDFAIEINDVNFDYETWVTAHCYSTKAEAESKLKELQEKQK